MPEKINHTFQSNEKKFYGWWIVAAGSIILFISSGIGFYCHSVILDPLRNLHAWSKGTVSAAITLFFFTNGIVGFILGQWIDRYGPKWFLVIGSIVFGAGLYALKWVDTIPQLFIIYLIMSLGFCSTALIPINTLITNWFIRKRGLAMSIANTGLSVGGMILVPMTSFLIIQMGLDQTLLILGCIYILIISSVSIFFIKHRPSDINQYPDGLTKQHEQIIVNHKKTETQMNVWTRRQALKTIAFWSIALAFMLALAGQIAYLVHQVSFLSQYLGPQKAASTVSITAGASIVGRLVLGQFVDRQGVFILYQLHNKIIKLHVILDKSIQMIYKSFVLGIIGDKHALSRYYSSPGKPL